MIGVFDSGSGGLTVVRAIRERLPHADILYFGDIKNAPYGEKTPEELSRLTIEGIKLLIDHGATSIVSACNSVSASLALSLFDALDLEPDRLIEMVGPTVSYVKDSPARILLVATPATVRSGIYQNAFRMIGKEVTAIAIPELARHIEFGSLDEEIKTTMSEALDKLPEDIDTLILACTHYPLVYDMFRRAVPERVMVFDPAEAVAERVERRFWPREAGNGTTTCMISKESPIFRSFAKRVLPDSVQIKVLS